jgi:drug/metabolite transporter (DMT)-like permease
MSSEEPAVAPGRVPAAAVRPGAADYMLLGGISLAWGTSYMFTKIAVAEVTPLTLVATRIAIAAAVVVTYALLRAIPFPSRRDVATLVLVGLLSNAAPLALIAVSVSQVASSVTAITMALVPVITLWLGVFAGSRPDLRSLAGIALGLAGVIVLFGPDALTSFGGDTLGLVAAVAAAFVFSASLFASRRVRHINPVMVTAVSLCMATGWSMLLALAIDGVPGRLPPLPVAGAIVVLAVWNTAGASLMMFGLLGRATPEFTSYNNHLVPAVAVICGTVFLGEPMTLVSVVGVGLVLGGVAVSTIRPRAGGRHG